MAPPELRAEDKERYVGRLFARIAPRYDLLNTLMTGGAHHRWRGEAARLAARGLESTALDMGTGTGDLALALLRQPGMRQVVAVDFVPEMLLRARAKSLKHGRHRQMLLVRGDALHLPLPDRACACAVSGFTMRNVSDVRRTLAEMARVVRPGGRVVVLELTPVSWPGPFRWLFRRYFHTIVPLMGAFLASGRDDYAYLPASVDGFLTAQELARLMEDVGLRQVHFVKRGMGNVAIHVGVVA